MTTWAQPIRHPWFDPPTMKRKQFTDDDDALPSNVPSATFSTRRRKRARYDSLERTLAHMTLDNALATTSEDIDAWPKISLPRPRQQAILSVVLPSSVEEPGVAAPEEGDMEVEPILVTADMSATNPPLPHEWESVTSGQLEIKEVQISSAVLDCLQRQPKQPAPIPLSSQTSQALILYRAPRPLCEDQLEKSATAPILIAHEDDVMEIE